MEKKNNLFSSKISYSKNDYARLNYLELEDAENTLQLIKWLSKERGNDILRCGLRVYRIMKDVEEMISPIRQNELRAAAKILGYKDSQQLFDELYETSDPLLARRLEMGRLLDSKEDYEPHVITNGQLEAAAMKIRIDKEQLRELMSSNPDLLIENSLNSKSKSRRKLHGNTDYPLTILTVYLREHLKSTTGKYLYEAIDGFLCDQGIMDDMHDNSTISRRATRYGLDKLHEVYNFFRDIVEPHIGVARSIEEILKSDQEMQKLAIDCRKEGIKENAVFFPEWKDFLPS